MRPLQTKPYMLDEEEGQSLSSFGTLVWVKATSEQTGGAFNLFDIFCPPGYATSLHIHYAEDVAIYVLAGALTVFWGNEKQSGIAGAYFFQPRGTPHGFRVEGGAPARLLYITTPAGLDRLVSEQELPVPEAKSVADAALYKIEILGPLLE